MITLIILFVISIPLIWALLQYINHVLNLKNYPPGPFPLPVIGNLHLMGPRPYETFRDLAGKYGDVFSISFGIQRFVIINSCGPAREALITKGNKFAGRNTTLYTTALISRGFKDIVFADYGPVWSFTRKLGSSSLKMYADGFGNLENLILKEAEALHIRLKDQTGKPVDMQYQLGLTVLNIICAMICGQRYEHVDDPEFRKVVKMANFFVSGFSHVDAVAFLPWLRFFVKQKGLSLIKEGLKISTLLIHEKVQQHKREYDPENLRDLTDSLIKASTEEKWENAEGREITDDHLEAILQNMFIAGSETTVTTLRWCITYLLHWPEYQDEIYRQIIEVIGTKRYPELKDRPKMPLLQATLHETLRLSSLAPLGMPHKATENGTISGHNIPKDTPIIFNLWNIHHDEREWEHPNEFNPRRWLDEDKKFVSGKHKSFLAFSAGRRVCLGESIARTELFVILSRLIRDFKIEPNIDEPFPSLQGRVGASLSPFPFTVLMIPRE